MLWLFDPQFQPVYPVMLILAAGLVLRAALLVLRAALGPADLVLNMLGQGAASALLLVLSHRPQRHLGPRFWLGRSGDGNKPCPRCRPRLAIARAPDAGSS